MTNVPGTPLQGLVLGKVVVALWNVWVMITGAAPSADASTETRLKLAKHAAIASDFRISPPLGKRDDVI
jgi:hypothetical protein